MFLPHGLKVMVMVVVKRMKVEMIRTVAVWNISWFSSRRLLSIVTDHSPLLLIHPSTSFISIYLCMHLYLHLYFYLDLYAYLYLYQFLNLYLLIYLYLYLYIYNIYICQPEVAVNCYRSLGTTPHSSKPQLFSIILQS